MNDEFGSRDIFNPQEDITLDEAVGRLRDITRLTADLIWETDKDRKLVRLSENAIDHLGQHWTEFIGLTIDDVAHLDVNGEIAEWPDGLRPFRNLKFSYQHPDGQIRIFLASATPVFSNHSGEYLGMRGIARDVTTLVNQEQELAQHRDHLEKLVVERTAQLDASRNSLQQTKEQLESAIQNFADGFLLFDADDKFVVANEHFYQARPAARQILKPGRPFEEIVRDLDELGVYKEVSGDVEDRIARRLEIFKTGESFEYFADDGRWYRMNQYKQIGGGKALVRTDITDVKLLEERLQQGRRLESLGQLTGGVAHDFNNLLSIINGNAQIVEHKLARGQDPGTGLQDIKDAVQRGASLTKQLLAFSRKQTLAPVASDINALVENMMNILRRTLEENIEIEVTNKGAPLFARVDPHQFENALMNLAINARDAMPRGGNMFIETADMTLDQNAANAMEGVQPGDYVMVSVRDTGSGMTPEVQEKALEPFFTTKEVGKGSGLGLSMVYGFARQSNGFMSVVSEVDKGTTIKLCVPRAAEQTSEPEPDSPR
jgi:PAS domain S-box-containing protein